MPWRHIWRPPRINTAIPVLETLPHGIAEERIHSWIYRLAWGTTDDGEQHEYYYCRHCKGWIEGQPAEHGEHSLGVLSGRSGTVYECIRCEEEVGFNGIVS